MLQLERSSLDAIRRHGRGEYPHECCGLLLGSFGRDGLRQVRRAAPARNAHPEASRRRDRFTLDPQDFLRADREARRQGLEIVGFYHSHPDHPARPSATDAAGAHPVYSYLIVAVHEGEPGEVTSWRYEEGTFRDEPIEEVDFPLG